MFRKIVPTYCPKYIIYGNCRVCINQSLTDIISAISVNIPVEETVTEDTYVNILKKNNKESSIKFITNSSQVDHNYLIDRALKYISEKFGKVGKDNVDTIKNDILNLTYYDGSMERWNITNIARKYKLSGKDVFIAMASHFECSQQTTEKMEEDFNNVCKDSDYAYFDWYNNRGIKNSFPKNIYNNLTPFILNMRRYEDRNGYSYEKIFYLIIRSIINKSIDNNYEKINEDEYHKSKNNKLHTVTNKEIESHNSHINYSEEQKELLNSYTLNKVPFSSNHRNSVLRDKNDEIWPYQMKEFYDKYVSSKLNECELLLGFDWYYGSIQLNHKIQMKDISVINMLIYGKTFITSLNDVERILSYVRINFDRENEIYQLDNYVITWKFLYSNNPKRYTISWNDENVDTIDFARKDIDKLYAAKYLIQLMNEVDPNLLNINNYLWISNWYTKNNLAIQTAHNATTIFFK